MRHRKPVASLLLVAAAAAIVACGASSSDGATTQPFTPNPNPVATLASCGTSNALFSVSPVAEADILGWVPLGNLGPPGHLFPTDHQYVYINNPNDLSTVRQVKLVSPGDITITLAHRTHYSNSDTYDYAFMFNPCAEVRGEFGHVTTLAPALLEQMGAFDQQCDSSTLNGLVTFANCYTKPIAVKVTAGDPIGTTGGQGTSFGLDFSLVDRRVAPIVVANLATWTSDPSASDHLHVVPASDYFTEPARSMIRAKLGNYNGTEHRTLEPVGGTIAVDVAGTLQGVWVNPAKSLYPEQSHLAVVPDNVDPTRMSVSMGVSQPGFWPGLYRFTPRSSGLVNREPAQIVPDGNIYCFEFAGNDGMIIMRLEDASTVRVEGRNGITTCAAEEPWTFTANAFVYKR
jgi:hypothetical protein